jgi:carboxymethylenebutenolidase
MNTEEVVVTTLDGRPMRAYVAWPDSTRALRPAVVLGELFGLNDVQRSAADRVAAMGHVAIAPDLLHRHVVDGPLPEDDDGRRRGLELAAALTRVEVLSDVRDALNAARGRAEAGDALPVAVGMSFGGHVALLATACLQLPACAVLYPGWLTGTGIAMSRPEPTGSLAPRIAASCGRVLLITGDADAMVPRDDVAIVRRWFATAGANLEVVTNPGVGHRFCAEGRPGYDAVAAADAWRRVGAHLGSDHAGHGAHERAGASGV